MKISISQAKSPTSFQVYRDELRHQNPLHTLEAIMEESHLLHLPFDYNIKSLERLVISYKKGTGRVTDGAYAQVYFYIKKLLKYSPLLQINQ